MENRRHKYRLFAFVLILVLCGVRPVYASNGWETNVIVSSGVAENRLSLGQKSDATDGVDGRYDVTAMFGGDVKAYFDSSIGALWRDIKALEGRKSWVVNVDSSLKGGNISLKWNAAGFPLGYSVRLVDRVAGASVNMASTGVYTYSNTGPRALVIEVEAPLVVGSEQGQVSGEDLNATGSSATDASVGNGENGNRWTYFYGVESGYYNTRAGESSENDFNDGEGGDEWGGVAYESPGYRDYGTGVEDTSGFYDEGGAGWYASPEPEGAAEPTGALLETPADLDGWVQESRGIHLRWEDSSVGVYVFSVERKEGREEEWNTIALVVGTSSYHDNIRNLLVDKVYFYRVKAFGGEKESEYSNIVAFDSDGRIKVIEKEEKAGLNEEKKEKVATL